MLKLDLEDAVENVSFDDLTVASKPKINVTDVSVLGRLPLCADIERYMMLLNYDIKSLMSLLDCVAQACELISPSQPFKFLDDLEQTLNSLHASINLWKIAGCLDIKDERIWDTFLSIFLRIPERFVAVFESSSLTISNPRNFYLKIFRDLHERDVLITACSSRLLSRVLISGFQDEFCSALIQNDGSGIVTLALARSLSFNKALSFIQLYMNSAFVESNNSAHLIRILNQSLCPLLLESGSLLFSLLEDMIKYQKIPIVASTALIALLMWQDANINIPAFITRLMSMKATSTYAIKLTIAFLSFVPGYELATENYSLIRLTTESLTRLLNDPNSEIRLGAMVLAECYGRVSGSPKPLYFDLDESDEDILELRSISHLVREVDSVIYPSQCFIPYKYQKPLFELAVDTTVPDEYSNIGLAASVAAPVLPDDGKTEIPPIWSGEPRNSKLRQPKFLKDCLEFLRSEDPDKWELALHCLPSVINQAFQMELKEFGLQLFKTLLFLSDQYKLADFERKRMALLRDLLFRIPENSLRMLKCEFVGRSLNLGQKSDILTLIMTTLKSLYTTKASPIETKDEISDLLAQISIKDDFDFRIVQSPCNFTALVMHFLLPLLGDLQDARAKTFFVAQDFLLEKTILCMSIFFYLSSNFLQYPQMVASALIFLRPVVLETRTYSLPIQRATLQCFHALFSSWPSHLPIAPLFEDVIKISSFSSELAASTTDPELLMHCAKMQASLRAVADIKRICRENLELSSLDITHVRTKMLH